MVKKWMGAGDGIVWGDLSSITCGLIVSKCLREDAYIVYRWSFPLVHWKHFCFRELYVSSIITLYKSDLFLEVFFFFFFFPVLSIESREQGIASCCAIEIHLQALKDFLDIPLPVSPMAKRNVLFSELLLSFT